LPKLIGIWECEFFTEISALAGGGEGVHGDGLRGGCFAVDLEETRLADGGVLVECIRRVGGRAEICSSRVAVGLDAGYILLRNNRVDKVIFLTIGANVHMSLKFFG
jgi:hypothetical protein